MERDREKKRHMRGDRHTRHEKRGTDSSVCTFKTLSCVRSKRSRVYVTPLFGRCAEQSSFTSCINPDPQASHFRIASLITRVPEPDALVAGTDVNIILPDVYTTCNVRAQLVEAHQFTKTPTTTGAQKREQSCNKLVLLTVSVTLTHGQLGIFDNGLPTVSTS